MSKKEAPKPEPCMDLTVADLIIKSGREALTAAEKGLKRLSEQGIDTSELVTGLKQGKLSKRIAERLLKKSKGE